MHQGTGRELCAYSPNVVRGSSPKAVIRSFEEIIPTLSIPADDLSFGGDPYIVR
jgi:hypothetical protein